VGATLAPTRVRERITIGPPGHRDKAPVDAEATALAEDPADASLVSAL
jgi:hypothetical protein